MNGQDRRPCPAPRSPRTRAGQLHRRAFGGPPAGEFGAEVIKVEQPGIGDQVRRWRLHRGETSMMWRTLGRNKKSVTIDLRTAEGQELVRRLADRVDVVIENYRPGKLESWGLGARRAA